MSKHKIKQKKCLRKNTTEIQLKALPCYDLMRDTIKHYMPHKKMQQSQGGIVDGPREEASFTVLIHMFLPDMTAVTDS